MKPFLLQTAEHILTNYSSNLTDICIILPSRRSIVFLKKHLAEVHKKTFLAPDFFSIEDFFAHITDINIATPQEQLLMLYQTHLDIATEKNKEQQESLSEFSPLAQLMLADFNELDSSLADANAVFSSLYSIKELSFFGKKQEELSEFQRNYLVFFKELGVYYQRFTKNLLQQNKAYQGLIYRKAAENIADYTGKLSYKKYVFAGFNALTKAEEITLEYLLNNNKLDYIIDADNFYLQDNINEAGRFMRKIQNTIFKDKPLLFTGNYFDEISKKIHIIGLPQPIMQAKYLTGLLKDIKSENNTLDNTAIVPADESLLLPILHGIDTSETNITMGYPLKLTTLYQLLSDLLLALDNKNRLNHKNQQQTASTKLYYKDLFIFFNNPYIVNLVKQGSSSADIALKLQQNAKLFYSLREYQQLTCDLSPQIYQLLFDMFFTENNVSNLCDKMQILLVEIQKTVNLSPIEKETLYLLYNYLDDLLNELLKMTSIDIVCFRFMFENYISQVSISFHSDATKGLQILGLLETRTLDFKNIVILSLNEGILPAGKAINSLIPYDVKQHFGLQTYKGKDAVFSYHFYRLLQRASNIYLLYSMDSKKGATEKSRFIYQLKNKLKSFDNVKIIDKIISYPSVKIEVENPVLIKKTDEMINKLRQLNYSASSISTYLECGLRFYFRYILGLDQNDNLTLDDMLQGKTIGTVIHSVLEAAVENNHFRKMDKSEIEHLVSMRMCDEDLNLTQEDLLYEKNHLVFKIIAKYIDSYINHVHSFEKDLIIEKTEEKLSQKISIGDVEINLKGIIDRVDSQNGNKCIIDYKTGYMKDTELKIKDIEDVFDGEHSKAFQLLFYAYLYHIQYGNEILEAKIVSFRKLRTKYMLSINKNEQISAEDLSYFENLLVETLLSILNSEEYFHQTEDIKRCHYCTYKDICLR